MVKKFSPQQFYAAWCDFITCLTDEFDAEEFSIYARLIERYPPGKVEQIIINNHITAYRRYYKKNSAAFHTLDQHALVGEVEYSERITLPLSELIRKTSSEENRRTIWHHMLGLAYMIKPQRPLVEAIKKIQEVPEGNMLGLEAGSDEMNFLEETAKEAQQFMNMDRLKSDPVGVIGELFTSGFASKVVQDVGERMKEGRFDMQKIIGKALGGIPIDGLGALMGGGEKDEFVKAEIDRLRNLKPGEGPSQDSI